MTYNINTLVHYLDNDKEIKAANEALANARNEGWKIVDISVVARAEYISRVVTLERDEKS